MTTQIGLKLPSAPEEVSPVVLKLRQAVALGAFVMMGALAGCTQDSSESGANPYPSPVPGDVSAPGQSPMDPVQLRLPTVNAGGDQVADPNVMIMLQGSATAAAGATIAKVSWTQIDGPNVQLLTPNQEATQILAPDVQVPTQVRFRFSAEDNLGRVNSDSLALTVDPLPGFIRVVGGTVSEAAESFNFRVRLNRASSEPVTFRYSTHDGTAIAGEDYVAAEGEGTISAGQTEVAVPVTLLPDTTHENNEHFLLKLVAVSQGEIAASEGALVILNDDPASSVTITAQGQVESYSELKKQANLIAAANGYSSLRAQDLVISLNGEEQVVSAADGSYVFSTPLTLGTNYTATITKQPGHLQCMFGNEEPVMAGLVEESWGLNVFCFSPSDPPLQGIVQIAAGVNHTCALQANVNTSQNAVTCWGMNNFVEESFDADLDQFVTEDVAAGMTEVPPLNHPIALDAGARHTCVIDQVSGVDQVRCWGDNREAQATAPVLTNPVAVSAGRSHSCAIHGGGVACWGAAEASSVPGSIVEPRAISAGYDHTCTLDANGTTCWGGYFNGPLVPVPTLIEPLALASGAGFSCALQGPSASSQLVCWGEPFDDSSNGAILPPQFNTLSNPLALAAGGDKICVLDDVASGDEILCWQVGFGEDIERPLQLEDPRLLAIRAAAFQTEEQPGVCGVSGDVLQCSGANHFGEATVPTVSNLTSLVAGENHFCMQGGNGVACWGLEAETPSFLGPDLLTAGRSHSCALDQASGQVSCWGNQFNTLPLAVPSNLTGVAALAGGDSYSCALTTDGAQCWGEFDGQTPAETYFRQNPIALVGGHYHVCGLDGDGSQDNVAWCVGGMESTEEVVVPVELENPRALAAGANHTCGLGDTGVHCWGRGVQSEPPALQSPSRIFAGMDTSCAVDLTGTQCWGLGDVTTALNGMMDSIINPASIAISSSLGCVLDEEAIKCTPGFVYQP